MSDLNLPLYPDLTQALAFVSVFSLLLRTCEVWNGVSSGTSDSCNHVHLYVLV